LLELIRFLSCADCLKSSSFVCPISYTSDRVNIFSTDMRKQFLIRL
jgi:hypothetical protein